MKMRHSLLCIGLLALLLASPKAQAQLSNDLIMESYNSNISAITNGANNKSVMESTMERDNAGGVRAQVAPLLAGSAQMRTRAAQVGEELKLQTVVVQGGWQAAIREGKLAAYQQGIGNLFKTQYGMNMSQFKLTSQGFGKK